METFVFQSGIADRDIYRYAKCAACTLLMFWHPLEELHIGCVLGRGLAIILYLPTGLARDKFLLSLVGVLQLIFLEI